VVNRNLVITVAVAFLSAYIICSRAYAGFVMVSAYNLAPFSTYYEDEVMDALAQTDHAGIVYTTIHASHISVC